MDFDKRNLERLHFLRHEEERRQWKGFRWFFYILLPLNLFVAIPLTFSGTYSSFTVSVCWIVFLLLAGTFVRCLIRVHRK